MQSLPQFDDAQIVALRPKSQRPETQRPTLSNEPVAAWWERESCWGTPIIGSVEDGNPAQRLSPSQPASPSQRPLAEVLTVLLRGSECPFRCLMCDLWKHTHEGPTPVGELPRQLRRALQSTPLAHTELGCEEVTPAAIGQHWIKLYNASNFFAKYNVPLEDLAELAELSSGFSRVIVENHPRLLNSSIVTFRDALPGRLEVAMGLETVQPQVLERLNKKMNLDDFSNACRWLRDRDIDIRTFILLRPPGMDEEEGVHWCRKSVDFARQNGVRHISIVPVRGGNGALETLSARGLFASPLANSLERLMLELLPLDDCVLTVDLWDWQRLRGVCDQCSNARKAALEQANLRQSLAVEDLVHCENCARRPTELEPM